MPRTSLPSRNSRRRKRRRGPELRTSSANGFAHAVTQDARVPVALFMVTRLAYLFDVGSSDPVLRDFATLDSERFLSAARTIALGDWLWGHSSGVRDVTLVPVWSRVHARAEGHGYDALHGARARGRVLLASVEVGASASCARGFSPRSSVSRARTHSYWCRWPLFGWRRGALGRSAVGRWHSGTRRRSCSE